MNNNSQSPKVSAYNLNVVVKSLKGASSKKTTVIKPGSPYNTGNIVRMNTTSSKKTK
ncbi:MAG TPA: hypothetical protein VGD65_23820 [Chryseosolibacter sp.]